MVSTPESQWPNDSGRGSVYWWSEQLLGQKQRIPGSRPTELTGIRLSLGWGHLERIRWRLPRVCLWAGSHQSQRTLLPWGFLHWLCVNGTFLGTGEGRAWSGDLAVCGVPWLLCGHFLSQAWACPGIRAVCQLMQQNQPGSQPLGVDMSQKNCSSVPSFDLWTWPVI